VKSLLTAIVACFACSAANAGTEAVLVKKAMDDKAIVVRANGDMYLIEKGVGCLSLWRYEGKRVYVNSPGTFLGVAPALVLPEDSQECRIWSSESLGSEAAKTTNPPARTQPLGPGSSATHAANSKGVDNPRIRHPSGRRSHSKDSGRICAISGAEGRSWYRGRNKAQYYLALHRGAQQTAGRRLTHLKLLRAYIRRPLVASPHHRRQGAAMAIGSLPSWLTAS